MTRDEGVALIQEQLGFRSDLSTNIIRNMKFAQTTLEKGPTKPWFLVSNQHYIRTVADEERLVLPSGFLQEIDEARLVYMLEEDGDMTGEFVDLRKDDYDLLKVNFKDEENGPPQAYTLLGDYFRLFPTPDDSYLIKMIFYKAGTLLDTNVENEWLLHVPLLLLGKAGSLMASALRDSTAVEIFARWEVEGRTLLFSQEEARKAANTSPQIGGPH